MKRAMAFAMSLLSLTANASQLTLGAGGDIIFHGQLQRQAYCMDQSSRYCYGSEEKPDFSVLWKFIQNPMQSVDLMFLNLEGPSTKRKPYRTNDEQASSKVFNFDEEAIFQLADDGVDIMTVANNHSLDMGQNAISDTLQVLSKAGIHSVGMVEKGESIDSAIAVVEKNGIRLAFIGCTHHINGNRDHEKQVSACFESTSTKQSFIPNKEILSLIRRTSSRKDIDGVIFTPHWGRDAGWVDRAAKRSAADGRRIVSHQRSLAKAAIDNGAMTILGHHPHVIQPIEKIDNKFVFYSLGNFLSNQTPWNWHGRKEGVVDRHFKRFQKRVSAMFFLNIVKENGKTFVKDYKVLPTYMKARSEFESGSFPQDIQARNLRTLVPVIEREPFWNGDRSAVPEAIIKSGAYTFQYNLRMAYQLLAEIIGEEKFLSLEEFDNPERIFKE